ncbi:hypothetical protein SBA4_6350004 [Candidatus Sulfopaludibacter sp. SbA4]|nr:hypothetical protein SBA4_6350004 [Candidatus Sulfopaludibacter sp. SbA4]
MINRYALTGLCRAARPKLYLVLVLFLGLAGAAQRGWTQTLISITATAPYPSLLPGATEQLTATGHYSDGSTQDLTLMVTWSSENPAFATVTPGGLVTAIAAGLAHLNFLFTGTPPLPQGYGIYVTVDKTCTQDSDCTDSNLCTRDTCDPSTLTCQHTLVVDCSASKGACYQPGVCVPPTGECLYVPLSDGDNCTPNPTDPYCAFYSCESLVCTKQCVGYTFSGFFPPVQNSPILNGAKAGSAIPIKFSLNGDQGLNILAEGYPTSQQVICANVGTLVNLPSETVSPGASTLSYDATSGQYAYVWKTDKAWAGTCRQFVLRLTDGSIHVPYFHFK